MIDIVYIEQGEDLQIFNTQTHRAANILNVQLGSLEYEPGLGIDLAYFLSPEYKFQDESFYSYIIQVLANYGINVASITEDLQNLFNQIEINLSAEEQDSGLIAR